MRRIAVLYSLVFLLGASSVAYAADTIYSSFGPGDTYNTNLVASFGNIGPYAYQYASFTVAGTSDYRLTRIELALDDYRGTPTGTIYGGLFADDSGYPTGDLLESFELNGVYGPRGTGSIISVDSVTHPILQAGRTYWVGLWTPEANGYDWIGAMPEFVDSAGQERVYANDDQSSWQFYQYDVAFRISGYPVSTVVYDFSAPQFPRYRDTPFYGIAPNTGSSTFLADFTASTSSYYIDYYATGPGSISGEVLKSGCFCLQSMTITFNTPVYAVSVDFFGLGDTFTLHLTSAVGSASSTGRFGNLYFLSAKPFTSIQLGTGTFMIDNLTLSTDPPTPEQAISLLMDDVGAALEGGALTQDQADGLTEKLGSAITSLDLGAIRDACNQLGAFINQTNGLIKARKLSREEGQALIDAAEDIRARIGC